MFIELFLPCNDNLLSKKGDIVYINGAIDGVRFSVPLLKTSASDIIDIAERFYLTNRDVLYFHNNIRGSMKTIYNPRSKNRLDSLYKSIRKSLVGTSNLVELEVLLKSPSLYIPLKVSVHKRKDEFGLICHGWDCINKRKFHTTLMESSYSNKLNEFYREQIHDKEIDIRGETIIGEQNLHNDLRNRLIDGYRIKRL